MSMVLGKNKMAILIRHILLLDIADLDIEEKYLKTVTPSIWLSEILLAVNCWDIWIIFS